MDYGNLGWADHTWRFACAARWQITSYIMNQSLTQTHKQQNPKKIKHQRFNM